MMDAHSYPYYKQTIYFLFFIFNYKKEACFFTRFEELLQVIDLG